LPVIVSTSGTAAFSSAHSACARPSFQRIAGDARLHRAVHLPGDRDAAHRGQRLRCLGVQGVDRVVERLHPVVRVLLGPERLWPRNGEPGGGGADHALRIVDEHGLQFGCAEIDAEVHGVGGRRAAVCSLG
jgi:hypothetical protein